MTRGKEIGKFKADLNTQLRKTWNRVCEGEGTMTDSEKLTDQTNLVAVVNRIEEHRNDAYTQLTCRSHEWHIVEKVLPMVITEATPVHSNVNVFLPRRHEEDNETDWHRRVLHRTIRVMRLWEAAADKRAVHGSLRRHFNAMITQAKCMLVGEVAKNVKNIRIDPTGRKEAYVVEKYDAEIERRKTRWRP